MKILIIAPGNRPVPAIAGGAIQLLVTSFLQYNETANNYKIVVYSRYCNGVEKCSSTYKNTIFRYVTNKDLRHNIWSYYVRIKNTLYKNNLTPSAYCISVINDLKKRGELDFYDLIIIENGVESITTYRKYVKGKLVGHLHNNYINEDTAHAQQIAKSLDEVWGVSNFICSQVNKVNKDTVTRTLYNGIDISNFSHCADRREVIAMRRQLGVNDDDVVYLYAGRIFKDKGVKELVRSFIDFAKNKDNVKLVIVGAVKDKSLQSRLYLRRVKKICNDKVIYADAFPYEKMPELYQMADIQVVPSLCEEAFGMVVVEGIAAKNAMIITRSGGMPEIVNSKQAIIVGRNNIRRGLAEAMSRLYYDENYRKQLVTNSQSILELYDSHIYCTNLCRLIGQATGG